jgi:hypothetical protein
VKKALPLILIELHIKCITNKPIDEVNGKPFKNIRQFDLRALTGIQFEEGSVGVLWT